MTETETFFILVGYTTSRPIVVDEHVSGVAVATDRGPIRAQLIAAQMVGCHCEMTTSTEIMRVEI